MVNDDKYKVSQFIGNNQRAVNSFYKRFKQNVSSNRLDVIFVARCITKTSNPNKYESDVCDDIVGALVCRPINHQSPEKLLVHTQHNLASTVTSPYLLRSLYIDEVHRTQGLASRLIELALAALPNTQYTIFTLCRPDLVDFYIRAGFTLYRNLNDELKKTTLLGTINVSLNLKAKKNLTLLVRL